jgi:subtilisin-like proprotein convertase family protein
MKTKISVFVLLVLTIFNVNSYSQVAYTHKIDSILNLVSLPSIIKMDRELSGDTIAMIGGVPQLIYSRFYDSQCNMKAAQYIYEKFQSFGYSPKYMVNSNRNQNVYVEKKGTKYPDKKYVIGAHYDNGLMIVYHAEDTIHGADDNASGISTILELARLVKDMSFDYTVIFIAFDEEENGQFGSKGFVDSCYNRKDTLVGALVLDNIAYDSDNDMMIDILPSSLSNNLYYDFYNCNQLYQTGLNVILSNYTQMPGDHKSFWNKNYKAILQFEHLSDFNPYNHKIGDTFDKLNLPFFHKNVKAAVALILSWALDKCVNVFHTPISSSSDTSARLASFEVYYPIPIGTGSNAPRLYYKVGNSPYTSVNAVSHIGRYYNYSIPGFPVGSQISYYFALQDSTGSYVSTLPSGGGGANPPGSIPPPSSYVYYVYESAAYFSSGIPKPINDLEFIYDTIHVPIHGIVSDIKVTLNINHSNDGNLIIMLRRPSSSSTLSQYAGQGGQNFTGTIFDDTASKLISQGTPPFIGRFKPFSSFSVFIGQQIYGDWILNILDNNTGNQGTLLNWNIQFKYATPIGVKEINSVAKDYKLYQNYPNPFNPNTTIQFDIKDSRFTVLKVYDILGKEVKVLVNDVLSQGSYKVDFNGSGLSSGIYFYSLETSDPSGKASDFRDVKRMVLIK